MNMNTQMSECVICFDTIEGGSVTCKNNSCTARMCRACLDEYIAICVRDKNIPKCPNRTCGWYYLLSDIQHFRELVQPYASCCFGELLTKHGDTARKTVEVQTTIANLRTARMQFIETQFPVAIAYTARVIMPEKLRRIDKQVKDMILEQSKQSHRVCMNLTCGGSLDENLQCMSCGTTFCLECEKVSTGTHVCSPDDVETIKLIKGMVHCPKCHLPIERSSGCDWMTCAHCGENFTYSTGISGGGGNRHNTAVNVQTQVLLTVVHRDILIELGLFDLVGAIESIAPSTTGDKVLTNIMTDYYKNNLETSPMYELEVARAFEHHIIRIYINKRYHQAISEIERNILARTLTHDKLNVLLDILRRPL